jgi:hypothetical protein
MPRTKSRPAEFPKSNAVIGDRVYYWKLGQLQQEPRLGQVVEVGLRNEHGCFLNIRVRPAQGRPFVCSPFGGYHPNSRDNHAILEPTPDQLRKECAQVVRWFYTQQGAPRYKVRVARYATNGQVPRYRLICTGCWAEITRETTLTESSELRIELRGVQAGFAAGKPGVESSDSMFRCDCPTGPGPQNRTRTR